MYPLRILFAQPLRLGLTVAGIALCIVLMLFLLGIYRGVSIGSVEYVRRNPVDLWVVQEYTTNILRGFSLLRTAHGDLLREVEGVRAASPVLFLLCALERGGERSTVYLTGYDPDATRGGPPEVAEGRPVRRDDEIVLDRSFAAKHRMLVRRSWIVLAQWQDPRTGLVHVFESDEIPYDPSDHVLGRTILVTIDPEDPKVYDVDLGFLPAAG